MVRVVAFMPEPERSRTWAPLTGIVAGMRRHGLDVVERRVGVDPWEPNDCLVINGWIKPDRAHTPIIEAQLEADLPLLIIDQGYVLPKTYWSVGWGGLNGRADFRNAGSPPERWASLAANVRVRQSPWRRVGKHVVIMGQVPKDAALAGLDIDAWAAGVVTTLRRYTKRPLVFRPHPRSKFEHCIAGAPNRTGEMADILHNAWAAVTYNSSAAVEAVLAGIPVFAEDEGSIAWPVAGKDLADIERPAMPALEPWLRNLAYAQWTPDEMATGLAWEHLKGGLK